MISIYRFIFQLASRFYPRLAYLLDLGEKEAKSCKIWCKSPHLRKLFIRQGEDILVTNQCSFLPKFSLISTYKNKEISICQWLAGITRQTHLPEEIIISASVPKNDIEGEINAWIIENPAYKSVLKIAYATEDSISSSRNTAIQGASYETIVMTDCACIPHPDWLENLLSPMSEYRPADVTMGFCNVLTKGKFLKALACTIYPGVSNIVLKHFIPSMNSMAFTRKIWTYSRHFPKRPSGSLGAQAFLATTEDVLCSIRIKQNAKNLIFVPEAKVDLWFPQSFIKALLSLYDRAKEDGTYALFPQEKYMHASLHHIVIISIVLLFFFAWITNIITDALLVDILILCFIVQGFFHLPHIRLMASSKLSFFTRMGLAVTITCIQAFGWLKGVSKR